MKLTLARYRYTPLNTLGLLYVDGQFEAYTLEDAHRDVKVQGNTCIPEGLYQLGLRNSPKFTPRYEHEMIWLRNVPGFEYILIHPGNTKDDTEGCLLIGHSIQTYAVKPDYLGYSREAYDRLYPIISEAIKTGTASIEIKHMGLT